MLVLILAAILTAALAGLAVKWVLEISGKEARITWREYAIGIAISPVVAILVAWAGWATTRNNLTMFTEYWNGWEVTAVKETIGCYRDGPCRWEYDCDPYLCNPHDCNCVCVSRDENGNCTSESCSTCWDTCYHDCPYVNQEYNFYVDSTIGRFVIASYIFPDNPQAHRWRRYKSIPQSIIARAGTGEPPFWVAARNRCQTGQPGPVTKRNNYPNYILASEHTLMKEYSSDITDYKAQNLLPLLATAVDSFYGANKVSFIGWQVPNNNVWQKTLEYLNANFGHQMQGDIHLVIIKNNKISTNPDRYTLALKAYWQDKATFGNNALSKNTVVVLVGTADGMTVSWSRAFTGMPLGNERFIVTMRDGLKGLPLSSEILIGPSSSKLNAQGVSYPPDGKYGPIQRILWGLDDPATKFKRVSMSGDDGQGGFMYLKNEIRPNMGQMWVIFFVTFLACCGAWVWAAAHYEPSDGKYRWRQR